jgi:type 1 glutamine amidotransferase
MSEIKALLVGGDDCRYHDFDMLLALLQKQLETLGLSVTCSWDPDMLLTDNIQQYELIVLYTLGHTLNKEQESGLLKAVQGDPWNKEAKTKGLLGIHGASCSFLNSESYLRMLGGKFLVHPPLDTIQVQITQPQHPVMQGLGDFAIRDELYLIEPYSPFEVLAHSEHAGFPRPIVWVKPYGLGRICYLSLGHGAEQLSQSPVQKIINNAVTWILE